MSVITITVNNALLNCQFTISITDIMMATVSKYSILRIVFWNISAITFGNPSILSVN